MNIKKRAPRAGVKTLKIHVKVTHRDINEGECRLPTKCMHKIAIERALREMDPYGGNHHVIVDGGFAAWTYKGYRYWARWADVMKTSLVLFDKEDKARAKAEQEGCAFVSNIRPHDYHLTGLNKRKNEKVTPEKQERINAYRRAKVASGWKQPEYGLRKRIIGVAV